MRAGMNDQRQFRPFFEPISLATPSGVVCGMNGCVKPGGIDRRLRLGVN
jgi:hypothetical protein